MTLQSVRNYLSGVRLLHVLTGFEFPFYKAPELKLTLRGLHTPGHSARKLRQSLRSKMALSSSQGCLETDNEINQCRKRSLAFLGYHRGKAGCKIRREVSFFFILIPNSTGILLLLPSICPCCYVLFQEYCVEKKFRGILACLEFFKLKVVL